MASKTPAVRKPFVCRQCAAALSPKNCSPSNITKRNRICQICCAAQRRVYRHSSLERRILDRIRKRAYKTIGINPSSIRQILEAYDNKSVHHSNSPSLTIVKLCKTEPLSKQNAVVIGIDEINKEMTSEVYERATTIIGTQLSQ